MLIFRKLALCNMRAILSDDTGMFADLQYGVTSLVPASSESLCQLDIQVSTAATGGRGTCDVPFVCLKIKPTNKFTCCVPVSGSVQRVVHVYVLCL